MMKNLNKGNNNSTIMENYHVNCQNVKQANGVEKIAPIDLLDTVLAQTLIL